MLFTQNKYLYLSFVPLCRGAVHPPHRDRCALPLGSPRGEPSPSICVRLRRWRGVGRRVAWPGLASHPAPALHCPAGRHCPMNPSPVDEGRRPPLGSPSPFIAPYLGYRPAQPGPAPPSRSGAPPCPAPWVNSPRHANSKNRGNYFARDRDNSPNKINESSFKCRLFLLVRQ